MRKVTKGNVTMKVTHYHFLRRDRLDMGYRRTTPVSVHVGKILPWCECDSVRPGRSRQGQTGSGTNGIAQLVTETTVGIDTGACVGQ